MVGLVITARVKSSRLHEKVLQKINGRYTIDILLDHVIPNDDSYQVVLAIPENSDDDILQEIGEARGVQIYRGQDASPLHRLYECAVVNEFDTVIRITADDILIDQTLLRNQLKFHVNRNHDYTYMSRCPDGIAGEVISVDALKRVVERVGNKPVEFVSYYLKTDDFYHKEYFPPSPGRDYQFSFRLTMDYPEDLMLLRVIFAVLKYPFGSLDIINFLKNNRYLLNINSLPEVTLYSCNYNTGKYIVDAMDSIFGQDFQDFEFILMDDCSTDDSMNIITEYYSKLQSKDQQKMKVLRNEKNIGLADCSNKILSLARGKYIIRLDSDDVLDKTAISRMLEEIKINNTHGCATGYNNTGEGLTITSETLTNQFHPASCLLSTKHVNEIRYKSGVEYLDGDEFFKKFNKDYKMSFIPQALWSYRKRPGQKTSQPDHPYNKGDK